MTDIVGTSGDDFLIGTSGDDVINTYEGNDVIAATTGHDVVDGGAGFDIFNIRMGNASRFAAATGARTFTLTAGHVGSSDGQLNTDFSNLERVWIDTVGTGNFNDTIDASGYVSTNTGSLLDGPAALQVTVGDGNNTVIGSGMSDYISVGVGSNVVDAGAGFDRVDVKFTNSAGVIMTVSASDGIVTTSANGVSSSVTNAELLSLIGADFNAVTTTIDASGLTGFAGQLIFFDNNGSNIDIGSAGADIFANVTGAIEGHDVYTGNGGADVYDYTYAVDAMNGDTITDFDSDDVIDLRFNNLEVGGSPLLATTFIGAAAFTGIAGQYRYYTSGGQTFVEVDTDGDEVGDHSLVISNGEFQLVETAPGSNILKMGAAAITGTSGGETLTGTDGDDIIQGLGGADTINGGAGNDYIVGGDGNDTIDGGSGDDIAAFVVPAGLAGTLDIVAGTGTYEGSFLVQRTDGDTVEDLFVITVSGPGSATVQGINSAASLGTDTVTSVEELQFRLDGGSDPARFVSGQIGTTQPGGPGHAVEGSYFDDVINLADYSGALQVFGQDGNDRITGTSASEYFDGGDGNDSIFAGAGNDVVDGGDGNDNLFGNGGDDTIHGGNGDDWIVGGFGNNILDGGAGYDIVSAVVDLNVGSVVLVTGTGANIQTTQNGVVTNQITNAEEARVFAGNIGGTVTLDASGYVSSPGGFLWLIDHDGTDIMIGSSGSEGFANATGNVSGNDVFTGNGGADIFDYTYAAGGMNGDTITDFSSDDVIDLRFNDPAHAADNGGVYADHFIGNAAFTSVAGQYRYYNADGQTFVEVDSNGDGIGDLTLRLSNGTFELVETAPGSNILKMGRSAVVGTAGDDVLIGAAGDDIINTYGGNDVIAATRGHDTVDGGDGYDIFNIRMGNPDRFTAPTTARTFTITSGHVGDSGGQLNTDFSNIERVWLDTVGAGNFNDTIDASGYTSANTGFGALRLTLGDGNNTVTGSGMSDWINSGLGSNTIDVGGGYDEVYVHFNNNTGSTIHVTGSGGTVLTSIDGVTNSVTHAELVGIVGWTLNAVTTTIDASGLTGFSGQLVFYDNNGSNIDLGSTGSDIFANGTGNVLGHDVYTGNGGADVYDYTYAVDAMNGDTITDFDSDDQIDLRFNNLEPGGSPLIANHFIGSAAFSGTAGEYRYYVSGGQTFVEVDTNGDGVGDHSLNISNGQFQLVETHTGSNILVRGAEILADAEHDFNGDHRSDILWRNDTGAIGSWSGQENGSFANNPAANGASAPDWFVTATGDFNGDGKDDVLWRNGAGSFGEWLGQGNGSLVNNAAAAYFIDPSWKVEATGDFNGDGKDDIIWRSNTGQFGQWLGQADGTFVNNPAVNLFIGTDWHIAVTGDFNGDGHDDIIWRSDAGQVGEWLGQANGTFVNNPIVNYFVDPTWKIVGDGDFNGDHKDDILWRNSSTGQLNSWVGSSDGNLINNPLVYETVGLNWHVADIGDYNGDGHADLLWRSDAGEVGEWTSQANGSFVNNPSVNYIVPTNWHVQAPDIHFV